MAKYWLYVVCSMYGKVLAVCMTKNGVCVCVCSDHKQLLPLSLARVQSDRLVTMEDLGVCLE